LQELSIERNYRTSPDNVNRIKSLVAGYFTGQGLDTLRQAVRHDGYTGHNIIGIKPGTERPELVLIGAHFDAVENTPGADDNASGVAGMLEAGRILSRFTLKTGVGFAAFDLEEEGLLGSRQILKDTSFARKTLAYLNFDMIGYRSVSPGSQRFPHGFEELFPEVFQQLVDNHSKGDFLLICANEQSDSLSALFSRNAARAAPSLRTVSLLIPGSEYYGPDFARDYFDPAIFRRSDHASFWDSGLNALSLGDTAELRNANYHSGTDGCDTVDIEFISLVVKATLATVVELCGLAHGSSYSVTLTPK
jgi:Zn-dependent M28 family amino/carboxypeptidase